MLLLVSSSEKIGTGYLATAILGRQICNEKDFERHVDYIHYNPVSHQLVDAPCSWPYSSFRRYVEQGVYPNDRGADREITFQGIGGRE